MFLWIAGESMWTGKKETGGRWMQKFNLDEVVDENEWIQGMIKSSKYWKDINDNHVGLKMLAGGKGGKIDSDNKRVCVACKTG